MNIIWGISFEWIKISHFIKTRWKCRYVFPRGTKILQRNSFLSMRRMEKPSATSMIWNLWIYWNKRGWKSGLSKERGDGTARNMKHFIPLSVRVRCWSCEGAGTPLSVALWSIHRCSWMDRLASLSFVRFPHRMNDDDDDEDDAMLEVCEEDWGLRERYSAIDGKREAGSEQSQLRSIARASFLLCAYVSLDSSSFLAETLNYRFHLTIHFDCLIRLISTRNKIAKRSNDKWWIDKDDKRGDGWINSWVNAAQYLSSGSLFRWITRLSRARKPCH